MNDKPINDDDAFAQAMLDVRPIIAKTKVALSKGSLEKATAAARQLAAEKHATVELGIQSLSEVKQIAPQDAVGYKRPGVQDGVYRKLRLGRYDIEARLDLHQMRLEQAEREIRRFIQDCLAHSIRTVLILPGKGDRSLTAPAILKSHLVHWLPEYEAVQAFHTAQPQHGGTGAFYVLLRKSESEKLRAREQFSKGRPELRR